ncbi:hypothetical protein H6G76_00810 [Nostoc sp. FACHB-152]|uniref:hypothetical protein n=1 Tax=unclassified Nostoc TaxID=2593658 RepID=UPI001687A7EB|nr:MULTISPECIES: hypothetical protein [unclassified Nostoc]MBD2445711.1 hypothetical protein [Nostoc sp. FACHB-152]MBD2466825.1 hypothetical protein [Nostoc sp. FACHB-145]
MTFQQLAIGSYFRLPGVSYGCVYRKASHSCGSLNALLQTIRPTTKVIPLNAAAVAKYLADKKEALNNLKI